jgi:hypothetical protein
MKMLRRRRQEQQPEPVDQAEAGAAVLRRHRTRRSRPMKLELYKRDMPRRRYVEAAQTMTPGGTPLGEKSGERGESGALDRPQSSEAHPPPPDFLALTRDAPRLKPYDSEGVVNESEAAILQRRYGSTTDAQWRWA